MEGAQITPSQLEDHFETLIQGTVKGEALSADDRPRAEAIVDLHTGSDRMIDLIDELGDLHLLRRYLSKPLVTLNYRSSKIWLHRATADRDISFIAELVRHGVRIHHLAYWMISSAIQGQDADFLAFLRAALDHRYHILRHVGSVRAVDECTPPLAPFVAEDLTNAPEKDIAGSLSFGGRDHLSLKCTAALICSRYPVETLPSGHIHPALETLLQNARTKAGTISALAAEPSLKDVLARPRDAVFFGFRENISQKGEQIVSSV